VGVKIIPAVLKEVLRMWTFPILDTVFIAFQVENIVTWQLHW